MEVDVLTDLLATARDRLPDDQGPSQGYYVFIFISTVFMCLYLCVSLGTNFVGFPPPGNSFFIIIIK